MKLSGSSLAWAAVLVAAYASMPAAADTPLTARQLVDAAIAAHGKISTPRLAIRLDGEFDLGTRLQGRTTGSERTPITERITIDFESDRVGYDVRWHNYFYSEQHLREIYDAKNRILFIDRRNRNGGWLPAALVPDASKRFARYWPQALLAEAAARADTLQLHDAVGAGDNRTHSVSFETVAQQRLTLFLDAESYLLRGATAMIDMPLLGDTELMWAWSSYSRIGDLQVPGRFRAWLGQELLKDVDYAVDTRADDEAFSVPSGIEVAPAPEPEAASDYVSPAKRPAVVEDIADGVYLVRNLRPGFNMMFVEFEDFVVAVDAPTGWYEMQQIPPMNWSHGDTTSALSEKYLRAISEKIPGKPVRYVVLTHHHSDHIGGVRAFIAAGATVVAAPPAAEMARRAARSKFTLGADAWSGRESQPVDIEVVPGDYTISDSRNEMRLIELPDGNPKADGYLMVYLPRQRLLYSTAFVYPVPESVFPLQESIDLSLYFIDWLDNSELDVETHYNVHAMSKTEPWQLDRLREIAATRKPAWQDADD